MVDLDDPILLLDTNAIHVEPGGEARVAVTVYNPTTIVEEYTVEVLGAAAAWSTVEPAGLNIMPGENRTATVVLHPARYPAPPSGSTPFAVRCVSRLNRMNSAVAEADVVVGGFREVAVRVAPSRSKGIWRGKHRIVVANRGNLPARVWLEADESGDELRFKFRPQVVDVAGGGQIETRLKAKPVTTFLKGSPEQHRFELSYRSAAPTLEETLDEIEAAPAPVPLMYVQKPWLSGPVVALLALLLLMAVLAGVLLSLRDEPASEAEEGAEAAAAELTTVEASGVSSVRLAWTRVDGALGYLIEQIGGTETGTPTIIGQQPLAADAETFTFPGLQPATEFCFRLLVDTDAGRSAPSETKCATTAERAPFLPPSGLLVTPVAGTNNVQLAWTPSQPGARHVVFVDDRPATEVNGDRVQLAVAPGEHCFNVAGLADDGAQTEPANEICLAVADPQATTTVAPTTTVAATTTVAPTTTVVPTTTEPDTATTTTVDRDGSTTEPPVDVELDQGFAVIVDVEPAADLEAAGPLDRAAERQEEFVDAGLDVELASTVDLGVTGPQSWLVFFDGIDTEQEANDLCDEVTRSGLLDGGEVCQVLDNSRG